MAEILKLAVMALGGQGGGVLSGWITELALAHGWHVQATSVAGVAQRTGATIYYVEMAPGDEAKPVMALAPAPGDVDILIAAEGMEAGRAIMRGFVTPDRTTLIASTHRAYATFEKTVPGDGRADPSEVAAAIDIAAKRYVGFDMEVVSRRHKSVISASLFGALAGAEVLPFERAAFETVVKSAGRGVDASLAAFAEAFDRVSNPITDAEDAPIKPTIAGPDALMQRYREMRRQTSAWPGGVAAMALAGLDRVIDFQDLDYGRDYLQRLERALAVDSADRAFEFSELAAKYVAVAMSYDDIIAVADRKTRPARFARIEREAEGELAKITEYFHPGADEIISLLPRAWGRKLATSDIWRRRIDRFCNKGRRVDSDGLVGFTILYSIAGLRRWRAKLYRHEVEMAHLGEWFELALGHVGSNYALACEILRTRRLIKGYSDTYKRSLSKYDKVIAEVPGLARRADGADWLRRLLRAALQDHTGEALNGVIRTLETLDQAA